MYTLVAMKHYYIFSTMLHLLLVGQTLATRDFLDSEQNAWLDAHAGNITVLSGFEAPPNAFHRDDGTYDGLLVDYYKEIQNILGVEFGQTEFQTWNEMISYAETTNRYIIVGVAPTEPRKSFLRFTESFLHVPYVIITRNNSSISDMEDLRGLNVCSVEGFSVNNYLDKNYPWMTKQMVPDILSGLRAITTFESDAMIMNQANASWMIEAHGLSGLTIAGESGYLNHLAIGTARKDAMLCEILDRALGQISEERHRELFRKWGLGKTAGEKKALLLLIWTVSCTVALLLFLAVLALWNKSLKKQVSVKTSMLANRDSALQKLIIASAIKDQREYFKSMTFALCDATKATYTLIGRHTDDRRISTLAVVKGQGKLLLDNFDYALEGTPCENVMAGTTCIYTTGVAQAFPCDQILADMGIESYIGTAIKNHNEENIGIIVSMYDHPLENTGTDQSFFEIFAANIGSEMERMVTEQNLRNSEENYRALYNNAPVALYKINFEQRKMLSANPAGVALLGYSTEQELVDTIDLATLYAHPDEYGKSHQDLLTHKELQNHEIEARRRNGEIFWAQYSAKLSEESGIAELMLVDITQRKLYGSALEESEARLNQAQEIAKIGSWSYNFEKGFTYRSKEINRLLGIGDHSGITHAEHFIKEVHPEDRAALEDQLERAQSTGTDLDLIYRYFLPSREMHYFHSRGKVFTDRIGTPEYMEGVLQDVTDQVENEHHLAHLNAVLRSIRNINQLITHEKSPGKLIRMASQILLEDRGFSHAWVLLVDQEQNITDQAEAAASPVDQTSTLADEIPPCLQDTIKSGKLSLSTSAQLSCQDCDFFDNKTQHSTISNPLSYRGRIYGYLSAVADVQALKKEEQILFSEVCDDLAFALYNIELEQQQAQALKDLIAAKEQAESASRAKDEFLAVMSHEMRTPLNPILGFANLLREEHSEEPEKTYLDTIIEAADRQLELIDDILSFTKLDKKTVEPTYSSFSLYEVCRRAMLDIQPSANNLALHFEAEGLFSPVSEDLMIRAERGMLMQLLGNLLGNSCKYTEEGSITLRIGIETPAEGSVQLHVSIEDTGIGMNEEIQETLFAPFTQADTSYTRQYEGAGLGLAICRKLVKLLGGEIGVESELGKGSRFWFQLPVEIQEGVAAQKTEAPENHTRREFDKPCSVLIVEDQKSNTLYLKKLIDMFGGTAYWSNNGKLAVEACETSPFDIILMDLAMPVMNGFQATELIQRPSQPNSTTPIIALTADATPEVRQRCMDAGMQDYLTKPIQAADLFSAIAKLLK